VCQGWKSCTLDRKVQVLHSPEESRVRDHPSSRKSPSQPSLGGALVLDTLVGLMDKVIQLQEEVNQHGKLIITRLEAVLGRLKEERNNLEQNLEESN